MQNTLMILDVTAPRPYDPSNVNGRGIGGTEHTVVCVAEELARTGTEVVVVQHNRQEDFQGKALYTGLYSDLKEPRWVVVLRDPSALSGIKEEWPNTELYLWTHDVAGRALGLSLDVVTKSGCKAIVCVSEWHRNQTVDTLQSYGYTGQFRIRKVYNPLSPDTYHEKTEYDNNKLMWLASPHKGLDRALELFKHLLNFNKDFKFYITNPGYLEDSIIEDPDLKDRVITLGTLPHEEVIKELRTSLCLFNPNVVFPETFGKILAEANEIGTPVLAHSLGAAREVMDPHPDQIVDCMDNEKVIKRIMKWHGGERPVIRGKPEFKLGNVIKEWKKLLNA